MNMKAAGIRKDGVAHSFIWVRVFPNLQIFLDPAGEEGEEAVSGVILFFGKQTQK